MHLFSKILITFFLTLMFCNPIFAESFYFKECKLSENTFGDYLINFEDNVVEATLFTADGQRQEINDKIKVVTEDQVVTEKIKSAKGQNLYFVYYLDAKSKSITKQMYKKDNNVDFFQPFGPKSRSYCLNVKADWTQKKKEAKVKYEEERKKQEKIAKEERKKELEKKRLEAKKERERELLKHKIVISGKKWFKLSKANTVSTKNLEKEFNDKARSVCAPTGNFNILEQKAEILEIDETPAFGLEPKVNIGLVGIVECK